MVEKHHRAQDMGRISSKGINHEGSSSRKKIEINIKVRRGPFEEQMLQFMGDNKRLLNLHEHKLVELETFKPNT